MDNISVKLPDWMIKAINRLIEMGIFPNRSEFIRAAIRRLLEQYSKDLRLGLIEKSIAFNTNE
ncbi:MAG: ribbon-helix-helix domain-containing protein [Candidatus Njordarchaeia archaeon]|nr:type II toxin-antitoxin system ParD family antitoxin [Candidatus Korarchaeota archaeon]